MNPVTTFTAFVNRFHGAPQLLGLPHASWPVQINPTTCAIHIMDDGCPEPLTYTGPRHDLPQDLPRLLATVPHPKLLACAGTKAIASL